MGDIIVSNKEVAAAVLREGLVQQKDIPEFGAYLKAYDLALDGKEDGGFSRNQIGKDAYLTVSTPLQKRDAQFGQRTHRLIATLLEEKAQYQTAHPTFSKNDSVLETGAKILGALLFAPLGCGGPQLPWCNGSTSAQNCECPWAAEMTCKDGVCDCSCPDGWGEVGDCAPPETRIPHNIGD